MTNILPAFPSVEDMAVVHPCFHESVESMTWEQRVALAYRRARYMMRKYPLSLQDVLLCTAKFWALQMEPAFILDMSCYTIVAAHVNLTTGTLAKYAEKRKDLLPLINSLLSFDLVGLYLLSERGHGVDSFNVETTATLTSHGFILNTPREEAAKFMPATTPSFGIAKIAIVMARLIVEGEDRGCRWFIVPICNESELCRGVRTTTLPPRTGTSPLDFAITTFDNVILPQDALLGESLDAPKMPLQAWWDEVSRIPIGSGAITGPLVQGLKHAAYIGCTYSLQRHVTGKTARPVPLVSFRTQQWAMLRTVAVARVLDVWYPVVTREIGNFSHDSRVRHGFAVIAKSSICSLFEVCIRGVIARCGAQGGFEQNSLARMEADAHGVVIAEGDVLTLCLRLYNELLLDRYTIPMPSYTDGPLWSHADSLMKRCRRALATAGGDHRSDLANAFISPQAQAGVAAIGYAHAYSAALDASVPQPLLDIYECAVIELDPLGYAEVARVYSDEQRARENRAIRAALPHLEQYLEDLNIKESVRAPIVSDQGWKEYLLSLHHDAGNASPETVWSSSGTRARL